MSDDTDKLGASTRPPLQGIHHLKIPVADLGRSLNFYQRAFRARRIPEADHLRPDGTLFAYIVEIDGWGTLLELRLNPQRAQGHRGFDPVTLLVEDRNVLQQWQRYFDEQQVSHSPILTGIQAWLMALADPDGNIIRLYTAERHGPEVEPDSDNPWLREGPAPA